MVSLIIIIIFHIIILFLPFYYSIIKNPCVSLSHQHSLSLMSVGCG